MSKIIDLNNLETIPMDDLCKIKEKIDAVIEDKRFADYSATVEKVLAAIQNLQELGYGEFYAFRGEYEDLTWNDIYFWARDNYVYEYRG